jgi:hypothetical protein
MAGLVVLGVLTVIAGVLSGHSTVDYVLGRDAQEAVLSWAAEIDTKLDKSDAPRHVLDKDIQILDASPFQQNLTCISGKPAGLPANQGFSRGRLRPCRGARPNDRGLGARPQPSTERRLREQARRLRRSRSE